jgi:hypothetical protein
MQFRRNTKLKTGHVKESYKQFSADQRKFMRNIGRKVETFNKGYVTRSSIRTRADNSIDPSIFSPKEKFLFGDKDSLLFSENEVDLNHTIPSRSGLHIPK